MKKEEEKSYAGLYLFLSIILTLTIAWAVWNEVVTKRPWKSYQSRFHELEKDKVRGDYGEAMEEFSQPEVQEKYREIQEKLAVAWGRFNTPEVQQKYRKTFRELRVLDKEKLSPLKFEAMVTRNKMMEEEYRYGVHRSDESEGKIKALEERGKELAASIGQIEKKRAELQAYLDESRRGINMYADELKTFTGDMNRYQEAMAILKSKRPSLQIHQVHLEDINEADRCMSCHVGINRKEGVSEEQPYAGHSRRNVYLGNHPPEKFGCVLCHEGQGRATISPEKAHGEVEYWLTPLHRGNVAQSSCVKCHNKGEKLVGGEDIAKGIELFEGLGCFGCHEAKGFGEDRNSMIGPDLTEIGSKVNSGWLLEWLKNPKHFRPSTRMPDFRLEEEDAMAITSYLWQNSESFDPGEPEEFDDETIDEGAYLFESIGCLACHSEIEEDGRVHGPNLSRIGDKANYEYLVSWLLVPKSHQPKTRMPDMKLDEEDAQYIASYLMSLKGEGGYENLSGSDWLNDKETAEKGEELIGRYGCFGCHKIMGMEGMGKIGVELSEVGSKHIHLFDFGLLEKEVLGRVGLNNAHENISEARRAWFAAKLSDPRQFDKGRYKRPKDKLKMPDFGLSAEEIETLSILLTGMKEGGLPEGYIAKLSDEKSYLMEGERVIDKYNCMGCHQFTIDTLYLKSGLEVKGMVKLEEEDGLYFQLWVDNEGLGKKAGDTVQIMDEEIERRVSSQGGDISSFIIDYHVEVEGSFPEEAKVFTPPVLYEEGKKVQGAWLFDFLKEPKTLRPWLDVRMPLFKMTENEATVLSRYFAVLEKEEYPYEFIVETKESYLNEKRKENPEYLAMAQHLFEHKDVNCASCHVRGDITPEGDPSDWAPDLSVSRNRLKPDWIVDWLLDPQIKQPGTKMPKFFREGEFQDIFPGTPEEQAVALKDLLMNLPEEMLKQEEVDSADSLVE
ncbi:tetraheam c type cytochrome, part of bc1 complex, complex III [Candidatus Scalindua japonica]|uniref:Tetraheam c type cytochrome, part of bc1 complex, complex III n=1 Tax=Candidatus Scalindua japonica TaxID=1284222 RepID=A0A286U2V3_9BACT|nr:cytochrome c [Candidatus Scalindua japonica]GAX62455.1 tetraheam c type cytochrome, part of bc1 complex, complex III [Candidatus Scalindua japonica]